MYIQDKGENMDGSKTALKIESVKKLVSTASSGWSASLAKDKNGCIWSQPIGKIIKKINLKDLLKKIKSFKKNHITTKKKPITVKKIKRWLKKQTSKLVKAVKVAWGAKPKKTTAAKSTTISKMKKLSSAKKSIKHIKLSKQSQSSKGVLSISHRKKSTKKGVAKGIFKQMYKLQVSQQKNQKASTSNSAKLA